MSSFDKIVVILLALGTLFLAQINFERWVAAYELEVEAYVIFEQLGNRGSCHERGESAVPFIVPPAERTALNGRGRSPLVSGDGHHDRQAG